MLYLFILILLLSLSIFYDICGGKKYAHFWYNIIFVIFVLMAGLRYRVGVDTTFSMYTFFHNTPSLDHFFDDITLFQYPLWKLLNSFVFTIGGMWYWVQLIQTAFVNFLLFRYFKKHCKYIFTCLFFYYIWLYAAINFEEMKASFAIVLSLYSYDYIIEKKYLYGIAFLLLGCMFHPSAILVALFAFMTFIRFNSLGIIFLVCSFIIGDVLSNGFDYYFFFGFDDFFLEKAEHYVESDIFFARDNKSVLFYIIRIAPLMLYPLASFLYVKHKKSFLDILKLEPYLIIGLFMVGISSSVIIFYRYNNFYIPIFILFISQATVDLIKAKSSIGLVWLIIIPLFFLNIYYYNKGRIDKFYPYSSVIDKQVYKSKEYRFNSERPTPYPNPKEY